VGEIYDHYRKGRLSRPVPNTEPFRKALTRDGFSQAALTKRSLTRRLRMAKEPIEVSGAELVAALDRVSAIMKEEIKKYPDLAYEVAAGGLGAPSLAVIFTFDRTTLRHETT